MGEREDTKNRILAAGGRLVHARGFVNTGLSDILKAADVPKGSFYHYFKSKEDFGLALVDYYAEHAGQAIVRFLEDESLSPLEKVRAFLCETHHEGRECEYSLGCPLGKLAQEMSEISEPIRLRLDTVFQHLVRRMRHVFEDSSLPAGVDANTLAGVVISAWQGAVMRMKVARSPQPLDELEAFLLSLLQENTKK